MAAEAKSADVVHVALSTAFRYRQNVISVPQAFAHPGLHSPMLQQRGTACAARAFQPDVFFNRVNTAVSAAALVPFEYVFPQISGL